MFQSGDGTELNADVKTAANIARKATGKPNYDFYNSEDRVASVVDTLKRIRKPEFPQVKMAVA